MTKRLLLVAMSLILCVTSVCSMDVKASSDSTYAWPGRPGGNGDGSEEWLQGEYGEENGPYQTLGTRVGYVDELNSDYAFANALCNSIINSLVGYYDSPTLENFVSSTDIMPKVYDQDLEGYIYELEYAVSGRRLRIKIKTYYDGERIAPCDERYNYVLW